MRTEDFDYTLPPDRIAQRPVEPRDASRLMRIDRATGEITHHHFRDLGSLLSPHDLLVANDSRVIPARLHGTKAGTGGAVEVLLLRPNDDGTWQALVRGKVRAGTALHFEGAKSGSAEATVVALRPDGIRDIRFDGPVASLLPEIGDVPLPPYIKVPLSEPERYQTVYARVSGSAAAPTAGLHFTPDLITRLGAAGLAFAFITLHVGLDTFRPVETSDISRHAIHREWAAVPVATTRAAARTRSRGGRIVAVGTTSVRAIETAARAAPSDAANPGLPPFSGWTDLFITPGVTFHAVDALITNFHLPRSTLLMLVSAFAGKALVDRAYAVAIEEGYRFYSFGDAMLIV